jgi:hypothetical protein
LHHATTSHLAYNRHRYYPPTDPRSSHQQQHHDEHDDSDDADEGKFNLVSNFNDDACITDGIVKCVKLSFCNYTRTEKVVPFTLYGDVPGGEMFKWRPWGVKWDGVQNWKLGRIAIPLVRTTSEVYYSQEVDLIPFEYDLTGDPLNVPPFIIQYVGTNAAAVNVTQEDVDVAGNSTCSFFGEYLRHGYKYKADIFPTNIGCT